MTKENVIASIKSKIDAAMDNEYSKLVNFIEYNVEIKEQNANKYFNEYWVMLSESDKSILEYFVRNYPESSREQALKRNRDLFTKKGEMILDKLKNEIREFTSFKRIHADSNIQVYQIENDTEIKYLKFETVLAAGYVQRLHTRFLVKVVKNLPKNMLN